MSVLRGAGPKTAARLAAAGIACVGDLLFSWPRAWDDLRTATRIGELGGIAPGVAVLVRGIVARVQLFPRRFLKVTLEDGGAKVVAFWFRPLPGMSKRFEKGSTVGLAGPLSFDETGGARLVHPSLCGEDAPRGIRARYRKIEGVPGRTFEGLMADALAQAPIDDDPMPGSVRAALAVPSLVAALSAVHRPDGADLENLRAGLSRWQRRLALEEVLPVRLGLLRLRAQIRARAAPVIRDAGVLEELRRALPFPLTPSQERTIDEVAEDLGAGRPMQRLLQGDVGTGKTIVALAGAALAARSGFGSVLLAPTEILAEQHQTTFATLGAPLGLRTAGVTGARGAEAGRSAVQAFAAGRLDVLVGTHALFERTSELGRLGLLIVDEQHRFGVSQRAMLRGLTGALRSPLPAAEPFGMMPHLLVLTATPIPRTLALATAGDLDLSRLDERPAGRATVSTVVLDGSSARPAVLAELRAVVARGERAFVVCPRIEGEDDRGARSTARRLARELAPIRVGLVHGALAPDERRRVLEQFRRGTVDVLVATTLVEVGLDVPEATLMVVEGAEQLGLAQLHQLRGRVGRGARPGRCIFIPELSDDEARARLEILVSHQDGLAIAELDLARRGPGDLVGTRQSGRGRFTAAAPSVYAALLGGDEALLAALANAPEAARARFDAWIERRLEGEELLVAEEAG